MWRTLLLGSSLLALTHGFAWDEFNVKRLFGNSEDVFASLEKNQCVDSFASFVSDLKLGLPWAEKAMDAWAKEPAGLVSGVSFDFGHFDQCMEAYDSQYCHVAVENGRNSSYLMGLCVPDSCSRSDISDIMSPFFKNVDLSYQRVFQCLGNKPPAFGILQWSALALLVALLVVTLGSTAYELRGGRGLLGAFSLFRNISRLMEIRTTPGAMDCLNGIRVLSMLWIVLHHAHIVYFLFLQVTNPQEMRAFRKTFLGEAIGRGGLAVDTFLVIGGLLLAHGFFRARNQGENFNYFKYVLHRYLRLAPVLFLVMLVLMAFNQYVTQGPRAFVMTESAVSCQKNWLSNLFLVQNHANPLEVCVPPSWYAALDFQLYLLSPLILFPLLKWGKKTFAAMALISVASMTFMFVWVLHLDLHFNNFYVGAYRRWVYYPVHARVTQWLVGITLGYILWRTREREIRIGRVLNLTLWTLSLATLVAAIAVSWSQVRSGTEAPVLFAFFTAFHRQLWALAVAWIVFACIKGYGGPVNWLLSFPLYQPLAKLSYAIYLIHFSLLTQISSWSRGLAYFNEYLLFNFFLGGFLMSLLLAVPAVLMVEMPVANLETGTYKLLQEKNSGKKNPIL